MQAYETSKKASLTRRLILLDDQKFLVKSWDKNAPFRSRQNDRT
jgi:hypothetical protein